jgi:RHS repeat-associated protein
LSGPWISQRVPLVRCPCGVTSYAYDGDGNLTQAGPATYSYDAQDQLTSSATLAGTTSYGYALNGALSSVTAPGGSAQSYAADAYGDVASGPGGVSYGYDALGRLVSPSTASLSYLGTSSALSSDGASDYAYDPSGSLVAAQAGGAGYATLSDQHGDLTALFGVTSSTSGLAGSASYSAYGTVTESGLMPQVGYQGDYTDPATGLVMMGARWYNPATGSFTSNDTIAGSPLPSTVDGNPYAYTSGNPLSETDPTGHQCVTPEGTPCAPPQSPPQDNPPDEEPPREVMPPGEEDPDADTPWGWVALAAILAGTTTYSCAAGTGACGAFEHYGSQIGTGVIDGAEQFSEAFVQGLWNAIYTEYVQYETDLEYAGLAGNLNYQWFPNGPWGSTSASGSGSISELVCTIITCPRLKPPPPPCSADPASCNISPPSPTITSNPVITHTVSLATNGALACKTGPCILNVNQGNASHAGGTRIIQTSSGDNNGSGPTVTQDQTPQPAAAGAGARNGNNDCLSLDPPVK